MLIKILTSCPPPKCWGREHLRDDGKPGRHPEHPPAAGADPQPMPKKIGNRDPADGCFQPPLQVDGSVAHRRSGSRSPRPRPTWRTLYHDSSKKGKQLRDGMIITGAPLGLVEFEEVDPPAPHRRDHRVVPSACHLHPVPLLGGQAALESLYTAWRSRPTARSLRGLPPPSRRARAAAARFR